MTQLNLQIDGLGPDRLRAFSLDGEEGISQPFHFSISCLAQAGYVPDVELVGRHATLTITPEGGHKRTICGLVERMTVGAPQMYDEAQVEVCLGPHLSRLRLGRRSEVYGTVDPVSVDDVLRLALDGRLQKGALAEDGDDRQQPFDLRLRHSYPKKPHITQFRETDLDFLSRLAEHWGIGYFFEHHDEHDRVVFFDDPVFLPLLEDPSAIIWSPMGPSDALEVPDSIQRICATYVQIPNQVVLKDYAPQTPLAPLFTSAVADPAGLGNVVGDNENFQTKEEGEFLARVRAEELRCRKVVFSGDSSVARFSAGSVFTLEGHTQAAWNRRYLLVRVRHQARLGKPGILGEGAVEPSSPEKPYGYRNAFEAIPLDPQVPFRPALRTPRPRAYGLLYGRVESPLDGNKDPHLNTEGSYRVRLPIDLSGAPSGQASRWVRKAEAYSGGGSGMHFPLPPGTDVVLSCVNGDPDHLVIVGAPPSADNPSVVTQAVGNLNRIVTRSGIRMTLSDTPAT